MDTQRSDSQTSAMQEPQLEFRDRAKLAPFIVFTNGRSRTMWLSAFLTYGICVCNFEATARLSSFQEVTNALAIPGMGAAETLAAPAWRLLKLAAPTLRAVVVRRPLDEILASFAARVGDQIQFDSEKARVILTRIERALDLVSQHPDTLTVQFSELASEQTCKRIFEHCLPYHHDKGWWEYMNAKVLDPDVARLASYFNARTPQILALGAEVRHLTFKLARKGYLQGSMH